MVLNSPKGFLGISSSDLIILLVSKLKHPKSSTFGINALSLCIRMAQCHPSSQAFPHPTLGVSVPLCPGDYLLFNPLIPHCVSSRCKHEDEIICVSMYLKTAIVSMNDNSLPLTPSQNQLAERFFKIRTH